MSDVARPCQPTPVCFTITPSLDRPPLPAGKLIFERRNSRKAATRRKRSALHYLRHPPAPIATWSSPAVPSSPLAEYSVSSMGDDQTPSIPQQVVDSPLQLLWSDRFLEDDVGLMGGPDYLGFDVHHDIRDDVRSLISKIARETTSPSLRIYTSCRTEVKYKERGFKDDPYDNSPAIPESSGQPDVALYATQPGTYASPSQIVLLVEVKAGAVNASMAREVDKQIRTRANGANANEVNKHFYLIGWVGYCFRPYYWCQGEGSVPADIDPSRSPGVMRPSDSDLVLSTTHDVAGPHASLWRDIRDPENQRFLQQVVKDALRACDGHKAEYPEMYGKPCETVSMMDREASSDGSPPSAETVWSIYKPGRKVEVDPSAMTLRHRPDRGQD